MNTANASSMFKSLLICGGSCLSFNQQQSFKANNCFESILTRVPMFGAFAPTLCLQYQSIFIKATMHSLQSGINT
jgi:hypothetical protein